MKVAKGKIWSIVLTEKEETIIDALTTLKEFCKGEQRHCESCPLLSVCEKHIDENETLADVLLDIGNAIEFAEEVVL